MKLSTKIKNLLKLIKIKLLKLIKIKTYFLSVFFFKIRIESWGVTYPAMHTAYT